MFNNDCHEFHFSGVSMIRRLLLLLISAVSLTTLVFAQGHRDNFQGTITGSVYDSALEVPVEYASVIIFSQNDSSQVTGTITDKEGSFQLLNLKPGLFYAKATFMGYHPKYIGDLMLTRGTKDIDLGTIKLDQTVLQNDDVEVTLEKQPLEYHIDKKVVNVDKQYTAVSGTAVDVLENVPSVSVDLDGAVQLRGSTNFTVLIDGRPSVLDANDALEQVPATTIDNIEIITNPSAKYDPEGTSGIINIILKKNKLRGIGGVVNTNIGLDDKYGADFLLNYRRGIVNATFGLDYNHRIHPGSMEEERWTFKNDTTSYIDSDGDRSRGRTGYGVRGSVDFNITDNDVIGVGFRYGGRAGEHESDLNYETWTDPVTDTLQYFSSGTSDRSGQFYAFNLDYQHKFPAKGHKISISTYMHYREMEEESSSELRDLDNQITSGQITTEEGPGGPLGLKIDYTLPLGETNKFEAGYDGRLGSAQDKTTLSEYDPASGTYLDLHQFGHTIDYIRDIHGIYSQYGGEIGDFGYQAGLRGEYTYRFIELPAENQEFEIDRWDFFPTAHFSYQLPAKQQVMASYTRRIHRPRGWHLEPFQTWMDAYNVREGNPDLLPEYINSYEVSYQRYIGKNMISIEGYYRETENLMERIRSVYPDADNVTLTTMENVGTGYAGGVELMTNLQLFKWWNANLMGNLYDYRIEGDIEGVSYSNDSFDWNARLNNTFKLTDKTSLQLNGNYHSPSVSSQGETKGFYTTDLAVKQQMLDGNLTATLQVNDILQTANHDFTSAGPDFYSHTYFTRDAPIYMLNLSLNINNYRPEKDKNSINGGEDDF